MKTTPITPIAAAELSATAIGKSISFCPGTLFSDAAAYGVAQKEKTGTKLNPSQVVCLALERLFDAENFARPSAPDATPHHTELVAKVSAILKEQPTMAPKLAKFLRDTLRAA